MKIYVCHSGSFDYQKELYFPIRNSDLNSQHNFILPHEFSKQPYSSKELFLNHEIDLVLAEVSYPSTGMGIELGWANITNLKILGIHQVKSKVSNSIGTVVTKISPYNDKINMIEVIENLINSI